MVKRVRVTLAKSQSVIKAKSSRGILVEQPGSGHTGGNDDGQDQKDHHDPNRSWIQVVEKVIHAVLPLLGIGRLLSGSEISPNNIIIIA